MRSACAWCKQVLDGLGEIDSAADDVYHGICLDCKDRLQDKTIEPGAVPDVHLVPGGGRLGDAVPFRQGPFSGGDR